MLSHREEMEGLIRDFPYLDEREKNDMLIFLQEFFKMVEMDNFIGYRLSSTCR